jgi:ATP sulfurylase
VQQTILIDEGDNNIDVRIVYLATCAECGLIQPFTQARSRDAWTGLHVEVQGHVVRRAVQIMVDIPEEASSPEAMEAEK